MSLIIGKSPEQQLHDLLNGPDSGIPLVNEVKAHLPDAGQRWFSSDHLLFKLLVAYEELLMDNRALAGRLVERDGPKFGNITVDSVQPTKIWLLMGRENGKKFVSFSLDGPPSDRYILMRDVRSMK